MKRPAWLRHRLADWRAIVAFAVLLGMAAMFVAVVQVGAGREDLSEQLAVARVQNARLSDELRCRSEDSSKLATANADLVAAAGRALAITGARLLEDDDPGLAVLVTEELGAPIDEALRTQVLEIVRASDAAEQAQEAWQTSEVTCARKAAEDNPFPGRK